MINVKKIQFFAMVGIIALSANTKAFGNEAATEEIATPMEITVAAEPVAEVEVVEEATPEQREIAHQIIAASAPMNHEIVAMTQLENQHSKNDAVREEQAQQTQTRPGGKYYEPRISTAAQSQEPTAASQGKTKVASTKEKADKAEKETKDGDSRFSWGIKAGAVASQFDMTYSGSPIQFGFTGGLFLEANVKDNWSVAVEPMFTQQKAQIYKLENPSAGEYAHTDVAVLNYINIPLLAKYNNLLIDGLSVEAGLQFGCRVGGHLRQTYSARVAKSTLSDEFTSFDVALPIGVSYELNCGVSFGLRYALGLTKIHETAGYKNRVGSMTVGYRF